MYTPQNHTFAVCAYGESPYLEECILSLKEQTLSTNILLATSTPNKLIQSLCEKYNIPMHVNPGPGGIAGDWNFAVSVCTTPLVTIAHQDDLYKPNYAEYMLERVNSSSHPLIYFTNYGELRDGEEVLENRLLKVKRRLLYSLSKPENAGKAWAKRREAWEAISKREGDFLYDTRVLMLHRIHKDSETSHLIHDNRREQEDLEMLKKFWPAPVAKLINMAYKSGQKSNG